MMPLFRIQQWDILLARGLAYLVEISNLSAPQCKDVICPLTPYRLGIGLDAFGWFGIIFASLSFATSIIGKENRVLARTTLFIRRAICKWWTGKVITWSCINEGIGCFLKRFSINVKKKCRIKWRWSSRKIKIWHKFSLNVVFIFA